MAKTKDVSEAIEDFKVIKIHAKKRSPSLKRVDLTRKSYKNKTINSQYYVNNLHVDGAMRIDSQYSWGKDIKIVSAIYTSVASSDHLAQIYTMTTPASIHKSISPK